MQSGMVSRVGLGVAAILIAGSFAWMTARRTPIPTTPSGASVGEVGRLRTELEALRTKLDQNAKTVVVVQPQPGSQSKRVPSDAEPDAQDSSSPDVAKPSMQANLEARLRSESSDEAWSPEEARELRNSVNRFGPRATIAEVTCGSSLCRVVLETESPSDQTEVASALAHERSFASGTYYFYDQSLNGRPTMTLYVTRDASEQSAL